MESVQHCFTKHLRGLHRLSYKNHLKMLITDTLELRRLKIDLTMYTILFSSFFAVDHFDLVQL